MASDEPSDVHGMSTVCSRFVLFPGDGLFHVMLYRIMGCPGEGWNARAWVCAVGALMDSGKKSPLGSSG